MLNEYDYNLTVFKNGLRTFFEKVPKEGVFPIIDESVMVRSIIGIMECTYNMCDGTKEFTSNMIDNNIIDILMKTMLWPATDPKKLDVIYGLNLK